MFFDGRQWAVRKVRPDEPSAQGFARRFLPLVFVLVTLAAAPPAIAQSPSSPDAAPAVRASDAASEAVAETETVTQEDRRITRALLARLSRIEGLRDISVQVSAGVATLVGEVPTEEDRRRAETLTEEVPGVVEVDNQLRLDTALDVRLRPAAVRLQRAAEQLVATLPLLVLAAALVWAMSRLGRWLADRRVLRRMVSDQPFLVDLLRQTVRFGTVLVGVVISLDLLDATALVSAVIGTAGLVGLVLGFALRDVVENYIAGLLLSLRQPFSPNDHVVIDGNEGKVAALTTRATTLITLDGNHLRLPNALVFKAVILNYTRNPQRRFTFRVGIGVNEDVTRARRIGVETLRALSGVLPDPPPGALVLELAESSVTMEFSAWFDQRVAGFFKLRSEAIRVVKVALDAGGVDLPEPTYRVQLTRGTSGAAAASEAEGEREEGEVPCDVTVEDAIDEQVAQEQALTGNNNLLKSDAPKE